MTMPFEWPTPNVLYVCYLSSIVAIVSLFATSLAILIYFRSTVIRQAYQNILLLNLLVNAIILSVNAIVFFGHGAIKGNAELLIGWTCNLDGFINLFCCGLESYTLMCIAIERYYAIVKHFTLTLNQIIIMLVFGYGWVGFMSSIPYWHSSFYYALSEAKLYCGYSFGDMSQLLPSIISIIHASVCLGIISYCYIAIYQFYRKAGKMRKKNTNNKNTILQSHPEDSQKKDEEKEYRVFLTTLLLIGWTILGWTPILFMIAYQIITGKSADVHWDMVSAAMLNIAIFGDSIILLVYDKRWNTSLKEIIKF